MEYNEAIRSQAYENTSAGVDVFIKQEPQMHEDFDSEEYEGFSKTDEVTYSITEELSDVRMSAPVIKEECLQDASDNERVLGHIEEQYESVNAANNRLIMESSGNASQEEFILPVYRRDLHPIMHKGYKLRYSNPKGSFSEDSKEFKPESPNQTCTSHESTPLESETRQSTHIQSIPQEFSDEKSMSKEGAARKHTAEGSDSDDQNSEDLQMQSSREGRKREINGSFVKEELLSEKKRLPCTLCEKRFSRKQHLVDHMRLHTGEKPFPCTLCEKRFSRKHHLVSHMSIHTEEKPYPCTLCGKRFIQKSNLIYHMLMHTGEKPFSCTVCKKRFTLNQDLVRHIRMHTGEKPFSCTLCTKRFTQKSNLTYHMLMHTGEKPFPCTLCGKRFTQKSDLNYHMRIHTGDNPFPCTLCDKHFKMKQHLVNHMRIHTQEKSLPCTVCKKNFPVKKALVEHMCTHTVENP